MESWGLEYLRLPVVDDDNVSGRSATLDHDCEVAGGMKHSKLISFGGQFGGPVWSGLISAD